ncbi:MAG: rRNA (cytidine1920-2-O)/16S rRNA (cytidine1409-2-O)-methyltransferase [Thermoleophilaceae bacterium]|nr:rRNA (cytidine1920-2-O)/16S rRNA (cytidine1409-2-O)-methyltransferase [Thermoleophilaceae bacterium]
MASSTAREDTVPLVAPRRKLSIELARRRPDLPDPDRLIRAGRVLVDGAVVTNPDSMVLPGSAIALDDPAPLRGTLKLGPALDRFGVDPRGRVCLDAGASAGGFTSTLLERGVRRVYAVDVGFGQLLGSLRQDERVVNLERTNVAHLDTRLVPDPVDLVTLDLGYLSLADGVPQLGALNYAPGADLVALVKPMFELRLGEPPDDRATLDEALHRATDGVERAGWHVEESMDSPVRGGGGAAELFLHALRG